MMKNKVFRGVVAVVIFFGLIQLIPYGHNHTNPTAREVVQWDSQQTHDLLVRACYDCHSNESVWPWYSNIAPVSWLVQHDVEEGRQNLNFSEPLRQQRRSGEANKAVQSGHMPPAIYLIMHPSANLNATEKKQLIDGLLATFGQIQ